MNNACYEVNYFNAGLGILSYGNLWHLKTPKIALIKESVLELSRWHLPTSETISYPAMLCKSLRLIIIRWWHRFCHYLEVITSVFQLTVGSKIVVTNISLNTGLCSIRLPTPVWYTVKDDLGRQYGMFCLLVIYNLKWNTHQMCWRKKSLYHWRIL
jgi:hypothetical protein